MMAEKKTPLKPVRRKSPVAGAVVPAKSIATAKGKAGGKVGAGGKGKLTKVQPESGAAVKRRFWLTYPPKRIQTAVIWELGHRFPIMTNIRQASVTDEVGIVSLEVDGPGDQVEAGIRWLKRLGLSVEPVELSAVAS